MKMNYEVRSNDIENLKKYGSLLYKSFNSFFKAEKYLLNTIKSDDSAYIYDNRNQKVLEIK